MYNIKYLWIQSNNESKIVQFEFRKTLRCFFCSPLSFYGCHIISMKMFWTALWRGDDGRFPLSEHAWLLSSLQNVWAVYSEVSWMCLCQTYVRSEEELDSADGAFERQSSDQEDGQDQVRQRGGHVHGLMRYKHHKHSTQSLKPAQIMCGNNI